MQAIIVMFTQVVLETHDISNRVQQISTLLQNQGYILTCDHTGPGPLINCMIYAVRSTSKS